MWLNVIGGGVNLRGGCRLIEHGQVPGKEVDEGQGGRGVGRLDSGEDVAGYLVPDAGLAVGADYNCYWEGQLR